MRTGSLALVLSVIAVTGGCSVYDNSLLGGTMQAQGGSGGSSAGTGAGGDPTAGGSGGTNGGSGGGGGTAEYCLGAPRATFPFRPSAADVPDTGQNISTVGVMYTIDLGDLPPNPVTQPTGYLDIGLDIDGVCTTLDDLSQGECVKPDWAYGSVDGPGGIDNSMGAIIQSVRDTLTDFSSALYTQRLQNGGVNIIYRISAYNGARNDDQVLLETFVAAPFNSFDAAAVPQWDGTDEWPIASDSVGSVGGGQLIAKNADDNAYVRDGKLVASLTQAELRLDVALGGIGGAVKLRMALTASALVCDLPEFDPDAGVPFDYAVSCVLAGRWETDDLLHQISQFPDPTGAIGGAEPPPLCTDSTIYRSIKSDICQPTDTYVGMIAPNAECNALSMGVHFTTRPALIGQVYELSPVVNRCIEGVNEPAEDTCANLMPLNPSDGGVAGSGGTGSGGTGGASGAGGTGGTASGGSGGRGMMDSGTGDGG